MSEVPFKDLQQGKVIYVAKRMDIGRCSYHDIRENDAFPWNLVSSDKDVYKIIASDGDLHIFGGCGRCGTDCPIRGDDRHVNYRREAHVHHIRMKDSNSGTGILVVVKYVLKDGPSCDGPKKVEKNGKGF